jgi:glycosyltransferase involved in cell wall biosynthesis
VLVSVVVPARDAGATIGRTLEALAAQELEGPYEVIVVDDDSSDGTAAIAVSARGPVRLVAPGKVGAAGARNRGVAEAGAAAIAFTDADCFPEPGWLRAGLAALEEADLVQGRVEPERPPGPFDRTVWVEGERGLYETANLFVGRDLFERLGGFEDWLDTSGSKLLAEDVWFGWRARRAGARTAFADDALVRHAVFERSAAGFVRERLRLRWFPAIARKVPELRGSFRHHIFLSARTEAFDLAITAVLVAWRRRSPLPLVAVLPYARIALRGMARHRRRAPLVVAVSAAADLAGLCALVAGSARSRSPLL